MLYYFPPIIKSFVTRIRRIKYENEYDIEDYKKNHKEVIDKLERQISQTTKLSDEDGQNTTVTIDGDIDQFHTSLNCEKFPYPYILVKVALSELEANFLHPKYATPFIKGKVGETLVGYDMFVDHDELSGTLGGIHVYDQTNYPYTMDPTRYKPSDKVNQFEILGLKDENEKNTLSFDVQLFKDGCPLKKPKVTNKVMLYVASIKYIFQLDLLMRIKDYFFDRLLDSVTDTDPYLDEKKANIEEKLIKFYNKEDVDAFDLQQDNAIIDLYVEAKNPCVILRARNHYTEEFKLELGNISVNSKIIEERRKWTLSPNKAVRSCKFLINIEKTAIYHKNIEMGRIDLIEVDFRQLLNSDVLEFIDPLALDKALTVNLQFSPI